MTPPPLLLLRDEDEYRDHFAEHYCRTAHFTHDHIRVQFHLDSFAHAFYESSNRQQAGKDVFAWERAKRMPWIGHTLQDRSARLVAGWIKSEGVYKHDRRVAILVDVYAVIIRLGRAPNTAHFITAFPLSLQTQPKLLTAPEWKRELAPWPPGS